MIRQVWRVLILSYTVVGKTPVVAANRLHFPKA